MNLTLNYDLPGELEYNVQNLRLTDRGGFANFNGAYPGEIRTDSQFDPQLEFRAYKSAASSVVKMMLHFNISALDIGTNNKSHIGMQFPLDSDEVSLTLEGSNMLSMSLGMLGLSLGLDSAESILFGKESDNYATFLDLETVCVGAGGSDEANISNVGAICGVLLGAPERREASHLCSSSLARHGRDAYIRVQAHHRL